LPEDYLPTIDSRALEEHFIPIDKSLWKPEIQGVHKEEDGHHPEGTTDNARVLSGEVAVSPRISLFARVFERERQPGMGGLAGERGVSTG
jgi:hypothetical protein